MDTPLFKRQSTWVSILLAGLVAIVAYMTYQGSRLKAESYMPLLKQNVNDTTAILNPGFDFAELSDGWLSWELHNTQVDSAVKHSEKYTLRVELKSEPVAKEVERSSLEAPTIRTIPAIYEGKTITVKAKMKTDGAEHPIGLLLRIDGDSGTLQFDNMLQKNIMGTDKWKEYSVTLPLPEDAKVIYFGAILSGKGKLWVNNLQVLIDGKDISKAKLKPNTEPSSDKTKRIMNETK